VRDVSLKRDAADPGGAPTEAELRETRPFHAGNGRKPFEQRCPQGDAVSGDQGRIEVRFQDLLIESRINRLEIQKSSEEQT
jgi:hypothetical protein